MQKVSLVFPQRGTAPKMNSRNFPHTRIAGIAAYKSDGGTPEEIAERKALLDEIKRQTDEQLETRASAKQFKEFAEQFKGLELESLRAIADPEKGVMAIIKKQGDEINRLEAELQQRGVNEDLSVRGQVAKWQEANKAAIQNIRNGEADKLKPFELDMRAAATMLKSTNLGSSAYLPRPEFMSGINDIVRVMPTFWDYLRKGRTGSASFVWVNKKNPDGAAAFIGEGVAKPGIDFELATEISNAKKIAESLKASTEILDDIDGMTTFILDELRYQLYAKLNTELMTSSESATKVAGIQTFSVPFSQTGLKVKNPNNMDAIRACVAQLRKNNFKGQITAFVGPIDNANMDMAKANTSGVYVLPPFMDANGKSIGGATIVEDNNVADGHVQVACLDYLKTLIYKDLTITWGWENDDFTKNLVTVVAEMRIHSFHSENHDSAFIYDTFSNITGLIAEAS